MSLRLLIDMNLSPEWVPLLADHGWDAVHWSQVGDPKSADSAIMAWAVAERRIVLTHDLDFGAMLALTHASGPSVLQLRTSLVLPEDLENLVINVLRKYEAALIAGALIVVDAKRLRVRILPL